MEIEKKYQIKYVPNQFEQYEKKEIEQGYLCESPVVRIRKSNSNYILTYKSKIGLSKTEGQKAKVCNEVEVLLDEKGFEHLKQKIDGHLIKKTRYLIPLTNKLVAELDVFHGYLEGLQFVEVEFESEDEVDSFVPPEWFGKDVTFDERYANKNLAMVDSLYEMKYNN
ncbi:MAG: CYTH domain-containing protein [Velocimicrobium sp.]